MKWVLVALAPVMVWAAESVKSPDGRLEAAVDLVGGGIEYSVKYDGKVLVGGSRAGLALKGVKGGFAGVSSESSSHSGEWKPVWGERAVIPDNYNALKQSYACEGGKKLEVEWRAYNEGFAFRCSHTAAEDGELERELTTFALPKGCVAWAIEATEATYPEAPLAVEGFKKPVMMPLTFRTPDGLYAAILEAHTEHYPRAMLQLSGGALAPRLLGDGRCSFPRGQRISTPWRTLIVGRRPGDLIEREYLVWNLNPPCAIEDTSWIKPGLAMSNECNCGLTMKDLMRFSTLYKDSGIKYLQLDWGWYGTEVPWDDEGRATFEKNHPDLAKRPNWRANTQADPFTCATGFVPYGVGCNWGVDVDLDIPKLVAHLKECGMGLCLYIRGSVMENNDLDKLFGTYASWGVVGLKPGFVRYGGAADTDWLRNMIATAAKHHLWLCIHDEHLPDGTERTYPNVMLTEGGGGLEGAHPVRQQVTQPFTRCLAGPFDFTPGIHTVKGNSHAHGAAFFLVYPGASSVMRGGYHHITSGGPEGIGAEWEFVKALPMNYDETRVLDGEIGKFIVTARRRGGMWYIAGMNGTEARSIKLDLGQLKLGGAAALTLFRDAPEERDGHRAVIRERRVAEGVIEIKMEPSGGFCALVR